MKNNSKIFTWALILGFFFALIVGTFCYFLGKTNTLGGAWSEFANFGYMLLPLFVLVFVLGVADIRRTLRKKNE